MEHQFISAYQNYDINNPDSINNGPIASGIIKQNNSSAQSFFSTKNHRLSSTAVNSQSLNEIQMQALTLGSKYKQSQCFQSKYSNTFMQQIDKSKIIVENICNQIKYLIQGNLKNDQLKINMIDVVRDNIIPMLIKMFFQSEKIFDNINQNQQFYNQKDLSSTTNSNEQFRQITNRNLRKASQSNNQIKQKMSDLFFNQTSKSAFLQTHQISQEKQNFSEIHQNENSNENESDIEKNHIQEMLPKILYITIVLLKLNFTKKLSSFEKIRSQAKYKSNSIKILLKLVKQIKIKSALEKFKLQKIEVQQQLMSDQMKSEIQNKINFQKRKLYQKTLSLSCQIMSKIIKKKVKILFQLLVKNCLAQNKWMRQWIKHAALRSPLTIKTSIWRLKSFLNTSQEQNKSKPNEVKHFYELNKFQQNSAITLEKVNLPLKISVEVTEVEQELNQSCSQLQQSISSSQFDQMFKNQEQVVENIKYDQISSIKHSISLQQSCQKDIKERQTNQQQKKQNLGNAEQQENKKRHQRQVQFDDEYLNTISEEECEQGQNQFNE